MLTPSAIQLDTSIAIETAYQIGRLVGCDLAFNSEALAACLRTIDEHELILAMDKVSQLHAKSTERNNHVRR